MLEGKEANFQQLLVIHDEFAKALKIVEHLEGRIVTNSMNDARYALRGVLDCVKAIMEDDEDLFNSSYAAAHNALNCAWHDLIDMSSKVFKVYLDEMTATYGPHIVAKHVDVGACHQLVRECEDKITDTREHREARFVNYQFISDNLLERLLSQYRALVDLEPVIAGEKAEIDDQKTMSKEGITISKKSAMIAAISLLVGVLALINNYKQDDNTPSGAQAKSSATVNTKK